MECDSLSLYISKGNDSSDEDEEEGEVRSEVVEEGVVSITESLRHMNLRSPVCQPDRPTRVSMPSPIVYYW